MRRTATILLLSILAATAYGQKPDAALFSADPDCCGGIYYTYRYAPHDYTPVPKGYDAVYVSLYARHGSRWHRSDMCYTVSQHYLNLAMEKGMLTEFGLQVQPLVDRAARGAEGNLGTLTEQGRMEHRGIAERMYRRERKLFSAGGHVECRSTQVPRCIMSMMAFTDRMEEMDRRIDFRKFTSEGISQYMVPSVGRKYGMKRSAAVTASAIDSMASICAATVLPRILKPGFEAAMGMDDGDCTRLVRALYYLSMVMQDSEGETRIHDVFTVEERLAMWEKVSRNRYAAFGASLEFGDGIMLDGAVFLEHIVADADDALRNGGRIAFLRFGHDATIFSALSAMGAPQGGARLSVNDPELGSSWADFRVSPMASNLQWIFYRNRHSGEVLVKLLHNENECFLPIPGDKAPYYRWEQMRSYFLGRISEIRSWPSVRQILSSRVTSEGDIDR